MVLPLILSPQRCQLSPIPTLHSRPNLARGHWPLLALACNKSTTASLRRSAPPLLPLDPCTLAHPHLASVESSAKPAAPPVRCPRGVAAESTAPGPENQASSGTVSVHMSRLQSSPRIPLSPSSPPETGVKQRTATIHAQELPPTPTPDYMSVATKSYVANYHNQNIDDTRSRSSPRSLPRSPSYNNTVSTGSLSQATVPPYAALSSSTATATSTFQESELPDPDQHRDKRQRFDEADAMDLDHCIHLPSRDASALLKKEERSILHAMANDPHPETVRESLDELQKDIGEAFLLCRSKLKQSRPDPSNHLLGIYGLSPLLGDVIRMDPITGEKINKLRKSYEGQIKLFGLAGKNKPDPCVRKKEPAEEAEPGPLRKAIGSSWRGLQSDQDWRAEHPVSEIVIDDDLRRRMRKALTIQPGTVRNPTEWDEYLGHDKARANIGHPPAAAAPRKVLNGAVAQPRPREPVDKRTTRGKKRSYDDDSFVGYGDGYSDVEDAGSRDDDDGGTSRKKRQKPGFSFQ